jgi:hypothetical protein
MVARYSESENTKLDKLRVCNCLNISKEKRTKNATSKKDCLDFMAMDAQVMQT